MLTSLADHFQNCKTQVVFRRNIKRRFISAGIEARESCVGLGPRSAEGPELGLVQGRKRGLGMERDQGLETRREQGLKRVSDTHLKPSCRVGVAGSENEARKQVVPKHKCNSEGCGDTAPRTASTLCLNPTRRYENLFF